MTVLKPKDLSASVRQRLMNHAVKDKADFQVVLVQYSCERLLYRLSQSPHAKQFTVKGALMFLVWAGEQYRPTRDLDLSALKQHTATQLKDIFNSLCTISVEEDGLAFDAGSVEAEPIREDSEYGGIRVTLLARLGQAKIPLQVDIGFGDAITPKAVKERFPTLLDFPAPELPMYPRETAIAEKFETIVRRGIINSRMKDYYDIWALSRNFDFDGDVLKDAIKATFKRRKTTLPPNVPDGLTAEFIGDRPKQTQWTAFVRRTRLKSSPADLKTVVESIREFIIPASLAASGSGTFGKKWKKSGEWR